MNRNSGGTAGVFGVILSIAGIVSWVYGNEINGDYARQINSFFSSGKRDEQGDFFCYLGMALIAIGIIMLISGIIYYIVAKSADEKRGLTGNYVSDDGRYAVCLRDNGKCIWKQDDEEYYGRFKRINDNLWQAGFGDGSWSFNIEIIEGSVQVSQGNFKKILFPE